MNKVNIVGRLTADPQLQTNSNGKSYVVYTLAVSGFTKDDTDFVPCITWGKPAEYLTTYGAKGGWVGVNGRLNPYKQGEEYKMNVNAVQVELYGGTRENTSSGVENQQQIAPNRSENIYQEQAQAPFFEEKPPINPSDINLEEIEF